MNQTKVVKIILIVSVISIVFCSYWFESSNNAEMDALKQEAKTWQGKAEAWKADFDGLAPKIQAVADANSKLETSIIALKAKVSAIPIPPPPGPAPDEPTVKTDLESAGLTFNWCQNVTDSNRLTVPASKMIWAWQKEAVVAPQLRLAIVGYQSLASEQDKLLGGKDAQIGLLNDGTRTLNLAYDAQARRGDALQDAVKACESARRASTVKWYFKVGAAAAAGYLVGRTLK